MTGSSAGYCDGSASPRGSHFLYPGRDGSRNGLRTSSRTLGTRSRAKGVADIATEARPALPARVPQLCARTYLQADAHCIVPSVSRRHRNSKRRAQHRFLRSGLKPSARGNHTAHGRSNGRVANMARPRENAEGGGGKRVHRARAPYVHDVPCALPGRLALCLLQGCSKWRGPGTHVLIPCQHVRSE
eukprot:351002-Chlamydomonas_euryale.AAC.20